MIDATTLEHFGVFGNTTNGRTVFALLDHTISTQGRRALRRRIAAPPATLAELIDLQHAHRAIAAEATDYRAALAGASLGAVEHYLGSTWLLPSRMPVAARLRRWYGAYRADVQCGHDACAALASSASRLAALMRHSTAPLLKRIAARIEETTNADSMTALYGQMRRGRLKTNQLVAFDELARGGAGSALAACIERISDVEALFSVAEATRRHGWPYPVFSDRLRVLGLVHPLLGDAAVRNDFAGTDRARVFFITGPNMAGKSTFVKAMGIAVLLAHVGSGVPASAMETPLFDAFFSSAHMDDDLANGESLFLAEVRRVAALARTVNRHRRTFAIMDEPFRGTNVHDAAEATRAVVRRLLAREDAVVLVTSHLAELAPELREDQRAALLQFTADCGSGSPVFDFRLRTGTSDQRLGMRLLEREGVLDLLSRTAGSSTIAEGA